MLRTNSIQIVYKDAEVRELIALLVKKFDPYLEGDESELMMKNPWEFLLKLCASYEIDINFNFNKKANVPAMVTISGIETNLFDEYVPEKIEEPKPKEKPAAEVDEKEEEDAPPTTEEEKVEEPEQEEPEKEEERKSPGRVVAEKQDNANKDPLDFLNMDDENGIPN